MKSTLLIITGTALIFALTIWTGAASPALSREELAATFDNDMRNVKIEWDRGDTRPLHIRTESVVRLRLSDLRCLSVDSAVTIRRKSRQTGHRRRCRHHRR